jgi:hypothetical protein
MSISSEAVSRPGQAGQRLFYNKKVHGLVIFIYKLLCHGSNTGLPAGTVFNACSAGIILCTCNKDPKPSVK